MNFCNFADEATSARYVPSLRLRSYQLLAHEKYDGVTTDDLSQIGFPDFVYVLKDEQVVE